MRVTADLVAHVAALARLRLGPEEAEAYRRHLEALLEYVRVVETVDVTGVEPSPYPFEIALPLREDVPVPPLPREEILRNAPARTDEFFLVPKVIEGKGS
ncbi:MAG: Asp-tRNA(Asn)/Glu-tRNA(Gln) amidotransferase subunit GatC [Planctomycetales bacterium]|nr:Asp-tRNA(Asn)/Glu-tRNA(Gln) amidotransferase subunit GatC [Planctomycetales bacterium]